MARFTFIGAGDATALAERLGEIRPWGGQIGPWRRFAADPGTRDHRGHPNHPANYRARPELVDAVNTAIALSKPLLLTGSPGTGKSQLAERVAWELNLGPVLRFEAQSLSEANDLFYRFDLVGHLAAVEMGKSRRGDRSAAMTGAVAPSDEERPDPLQFVKPGPLGEAILRSNPTGAHELFDAVFGPVEKAATSDGRPSVVLIDEIDKASRDFPNDLLNGIERLEFRIRELGLPLMRVEPAHRPIVIITSNSERDLPGPFLRRCTFFHIGDPTKEELEAILAQRFFAPMSSTGSNTGENAGGDAGGPASLPPFYRQLLETFWSFRERHGDELQYRPGTSELIDWVGAVGGTDGTATLGTQVDMLRRTASSVSKHQQDQRLLRAFLEGLRPKQA
jgi:MoxR-like ATPase